MEPFTIGNPVGGRNLIGREEPQRHLAGNLEGHINTAVFAPRGMGKTSLMREALHQVQEAHADVSTVYFDLLPVRSRESFYRAYSRTLIQTIAATDDEAYKYEIAFLGDAVTEESVLDLPQKIAIDKMINIIVCIDEFQQFMEFKEAGSFLSVLRRHWQHHTRVFYCVGASRVSCMKSLFEEAGGPFHRFADVLYLPEIDSDYMVAHLVDGFSGTGKVLSESNGLKIVDLMARIPAYVMQLGREAWLQTAHECTEQIIDEAFDALLQGARLSCAKLIETLTDKQINFLQAVYEGVKSFYATETFRKYDLGTIGNIRKMKEALEKKGVLNVEGTVTFQDPVFKRYFAELYSLR